MMSYMERRLLLLSIWYSELNNVTHSFGSLYDFLMLLTLLLLSLQDYHKQSNPVGLSMRLHHPPKYKSVSCCKLAVHEVVEKPGQCSVVPVWVQDYRK